MLPYRYTQDDNFRRSCSTYESYLDRLHQQMELVYDNALKSMNRTQKQLNDCKERLEKKYNFSFKKNSTYVELIAQFKQIIS